MEANSISLRRHHLKLRTWLTLWGVLALLLVQSAAALGIYGSATYLLWSQAEQRQLQTVDTFWVNRPHAFGGKEHPKLASMRVSMLAGNPPMPPALLARGDFSVWGPFFAEVARAMAECQGVQLFDANGGLVYDSGQDAVGCVFSTAEILESIRSGGPTQRRLQSGMLEGYVVLLYPLEDRGQVLGVLQVVRQVREVRSYLNGLAALLFLCNALVFVVGVGLLHWLAERVCTPLERLAENTRRLGQGQFSERTDGSHSPYELWALAQAFDQAAARLQASFESQSRFVADASHELKTPLTILGGMAEILEISSRQEDPDRRKAVHMIVQQVERMTRLVNDLLLLSQPAEQYELESIQLSDLLEDLVDGVTMFTGRSHDIELNCDPTARVSGPETRVQRIFRNLLDNAIQHGRPHGKIVIDVQVRKEWVEARVGDDGPGISAEDLPYICDRFYRPDRSRQRGTGGTGLGLAIVNSLVASMNGKLEVQGQPGRGTVIWIFLPNLAP